MKNHLSAYCLFCLFFSFILHPCCAFCAGAAKDAPAGIESPGNLPKEVRVGVFNFDGYHTKDDQGRLEGYGMDLMRLLSEYSHLNFIFTGYGRSWKDMLEMLKNGEIDIVSSARRNPEREEIFEFSLPVGRNHTMLSKNLYNSRLRAGDYATYDGMKVGAVAGSSQNVHLYNFAKDKGFTFTLVEYGSPELLKKALQAGEVDAILSSNLRKPENETLLDIIKSDNFYVIARKEDQDLINEINYAIEQMNLAEGDWQNDIYYKHYGPGNGGKTELSDRENGFIKDATTFNKSIKATARDDMRPYSYVEDGQLKGILPDYFRKAMQTTGMPFELVAPRSLAEYRELAKNGKVDVVIDKMSESLPAENEPYSGFSTEPYMESGLARLTRVDHAGPINVVAVQDASHVAVPERLLKDKEVIYYHNAQDAMRAVQRGDADAAYVLPYAAQVFINREPGNGLLYTLMDEGGASYRMYVPPSSEHELITILKKAIRSLPAGTLNQIGSAYLSYNASDMTLSHYLYSNPEIMIIGSLAVMLTLSLLLIMWLRGRWNRRLLATTEHANQELEGQLAIVEALSRDYSNVLAIHGDTGTATMIKMANYGASIKSDEIEKEYSYKEIVSAYIAEKVHPEDREYAKKQLDLAYVRSRLANNEEFSGTYRCLEDGKIHYFQYTFVKPQPGNAEDDDLILAAIRNVDYVIRREQKQKKELADALAQATYANAAKTAFLNNMSHDIRTPMNAIIGFTTLAENNVENVPMVKRYLGKIMTSSNHLLSLINDVLDMSRIESGKVKIEEKEVHLPEMLHDLRTIAQADVKAKQLDFQIDNLNVMNETIYCDRLRLNQVLLNILSNAIKYTAPGGRVMVRVAQQGKPEKGYASYRFTVRDNGIGMSEEFIAHVFEPFEREQTTTVSGIQGTGLGLAITKNIVDMMGGEIAVQSEVGKGSEFAVSFRFRIKDKDDNYEKLPRYEGARALVVDDDISTCTSLGKMLSSLGLRPDWTTLGKEAIVRNQFASEQKDDYAIFFIDLMMADMNGIELVRRLRKTVPDNVPIIIMTAYDWTDIEEEGNDAGVTAFCSKPVFMSELKRILSNPYTLEPGENVGKPNSQDFKGRRLLLVEDNEMNQEIAQMILEDAGFEVDIVENGQKAVDRIKEMPSGYYELILMDVQMPVMNGYDATRTIRGLPDAMKASIPIIAMTANAFDEDREIAVKAGMNGYVAKPIDISKLMEALEMVINKNAMKKAPVDA